MRSYPTNPRIVGWSSKNVFRGVIKNRFLIIFLKHTKNIFGCDFFFGVGKFRSHPFLRILALDCELIFSCNGF